MMDQKEEKKKKLSHLKAATVGIGVVTMKTLNPPLVDNVNIQGTGFFVNDTGYVMTATHVVTCCQREISNKMKEKRDVRLVAAQLRFLPDGGIQTTLIPMRDPSSKPWD